MRATDGRQTAEKWLTAFAADVPHELLDAHVYEYGNYLWHIFSWELVECLSGAEARAAFDKQEYDNALSFRAGRSDEGGFILEDICEVGRLFSHQLDDIQDVYITASDFSWTYVHTHECMCGPYFLKINKKGNK